MRKVFCSPYEAIITEIQDSLCGHYATMDEMREIFDSTYSAASMPDGHIGFTMAVPLEEYYDHVEYVLERDSVGQTMEEYFANVNSILEDGGSNE
jgi:hypothetical protein